MFKILFVAWECWILGFEAGTAQNSLYIVFLQCIKVHLGVQFEQLEILLVEYPSSVGCCNWTLDT